MKGASHRANASIERTSRSSTDMADGDSILDSPRKRVAYDPDQDPEEKRVLRQKYRVLLKDEEGKTRLKSLSQGRSVITCWPPLIFLV